MKIRAAHEDDLDLLTDLLKQLFSIEEDFVFAVYKQKRGLQLLLGSSMARILVAEKSGAVVGMVTGQLVISTAEGELSLLVEDLIVDRQQRRNGIGTRLLQTVGDWAKQRGARRMQLLADLENIQALDFYEKAGWARTNLVCLRNYIRDKNS